MAAKLKNVFDTMDLDNETVALYSDAFQLKSKGGMKIRSSDLASVRFVVSLRRHRDSRLTSFFLCTKQQVLWSLGYNPTEAQLKHIVKNYDRTGSGYISFQVFLRIMADPKSRVRNATRETFLKSFSVFDKGNTGSVDAKELLDNLTQLGDTLTRDEAMKLISKAPTDRYGRIDIGRFVDMLTSE